eukprot:gb/GECH01002888.1/.p1 GENE.gb/GECH01002888.1/~~gb/GECH01002888.1/.p1  ORF type:complete len:349 (+),score=90.10 gb/GECH01002888.1/:1-1047(+)
MKIFSTISLIIIFLIVITFSSHVISLELENEQTHDEELEETLFEVNEDGFPISFTDVDFALNASSPEDLDSESDFSASIDSHEEEKEKEDPVWFYQPWTKGSETRLSYGADVVTKFSITDIGCPCEQFEIYVNGKSQGLTSDPYVKYYDDCSSSSSENIEDGKTAYNNLKYSARQIILQPGSNFIQIFPLKTCSKRGKFSFSFTKNDGICKRGDQFYVIRDPKVKGIIAGKQCAQRGNELAELSSYNFNDVTTVAYSCLGELQPSWIDSWNGDDYGNNCIALTTGQFGMGGALNEPHDGCHTRLKKSHFLFKNQRKVVLQRYYLGFTQVNREHECCKILIFTFLCCLS